MAKPTVVTIDAISDPILAKTEIPEPMGEVLRTLAAKVAAGSNWKVRKKALIDVVEGLDAMMAIGEAEAAFVDDPDADPPLDDPAPDDPAPDDLGPDDPAEDARTVDGDLDVPEFDVVDGETRVSSVEQAACYILSAHPEHQKAGWDWIDADYGNWRAFKKLLRADRRYAFYYDEIEALATADADAAGEGEADPGGAEPRA
jgi:hypothetical protein